MVPRTPACTDCERLLEALPPGLGRRVVDLADAVRMDPSPEGRLHRAMEALAGLLETDRVSLMLPLGDSALRVAASSDPVETGDLVLSLERYPELETVLRSGEGLVISDVGASGLLADQLGAIRRAGVVSLAAVPFREGSATGVLRAVSRSRALGRADLDLLRAAGHLLEHAIAEALPPEPEEAGWLDLLLRVADGVLVTGPDGVVRRAIGAWTRLGIEPAALIGRGLDELAEPGFETAARDQVMLALQGGRRTAPTRLRFRTDDGTGADLEAWAVRREGGRGILVAVRTAAPSPGPDAGEFLEALPLPAALVGPDGALRRVGRAFAERLGVEAGDLRGRPVEAILDRDGDGAVRLGDGARATVAEGRLGDGSRLVVLLEHREGTGPTPLEERLRRTIARNLDELEAMSRRLESMDVERARFLAWSAHELKTPLTVIQSHLEILIDDLAHGLSAEQLEFLRIAHESALHMRRMVLDLTDLAALQSGKMPLEIERVALDRVIGSVLREMRPVARSAGVMLEAECPALAVRADAGRVEQVLRNLLDNAIRFTPEGGRVTLTAVAEEEPGRVAIAVADTGIGIPPDELETVFEPFVQASRPPAGRQRGSGLGLFVCRRIALALGGRIEAALRPGGGTVFTFRLPLWPEETGAP